MSFKKSPCLFCHTQLASPPKNLLKIGRGCDWSDIALEHLAYAWIYTLEDSITSVDQTAMRFPKTLFQRFKFVTPVESGKSVYDTRSVRCIRHKVVNAATDLQKFCPSQRLVWCANPTSITIAVVILIAILTHLLITESMSYDIRDYPHQE